MKDIDRKDSPEISGGLSPDNDGCFTPFPTPIEYPPNPNGPFPAQYPGALPEPTDPTQFNPVK
jgi:hypothetical protein